MGRQAAPVSRPARPVARARELPRSEGADLVSCPATSDVRPEPDHDLLQQRRPSCPTLLSARAEHVRHKPENPPQPPPRLSAPATPAKPPL